MTRLVRPRTPNASAATIRWATMLSIVLACTGCRTIPDAVDGVGIGVHGGGAADATCVRGCVAQFRRDSRAEVGIHHHSARACGPDRACRERERARHQARVAALVDALRACRRQCYNEGAGNGGR